MRQAPEGAQTPPGAHACDVCLISIIPAARDPRVRKQGDSLQAAGLRVVGLCEGGDSLRPLGWPVVEAPATPLLTAASVRGMIARADIWGLAGVGARFLQPFAGLSGDLAERLLFMRPLFSGLLAAGLNLRARVYVANDWPTLPVAAALARRHGGVVVYDSHEYAAEELQEDWRWRTFNKPLVMAVETRHAPAAALISTVSAEIAAQMQADLALLRTPLVVRNVPASLPLATPPRAAGAALTVLYHGAISAPRRLDVLVASVATWRAGARLVIRGEGPAETVAALKALALELGLGDRVSFEAAVPQAAIVEAASHADLGFVCLPPNSRQNQFAMPNKAFEYLHAGLGLITPPLDTMGGFARATGAGVVTADFTPQAIAATVNALTPADVDSLRAAARQVAPALVWDREARPWVQSIATLVRDQPMA